MKTLTLSLLLVLTACGQKPEIKCNDLPYGNLDYVCDAYKRGEKPAPAVIDYGCIAGCGQANQSRITSGERKEGENG